METENKNSVITYVLLGKEAVFLYKSSINALINSDGVKFKVGAYGSVKKFMADTKIWGDFVEISKEDFLILKKHHNKKEGIIKTKKGFFSRFFKF